MAKFEKGQSGNPAGRPKGSVSDETRELQRLAREHSQAAIEAICEIMADPDHPQRLKAAETILARGHGEPRPPSPAADIIGRFIAGELSGISACLLLEAEGLDVPGTLKKYLANELARHDFKPFSETVIAMDEPPKPLPRE